MRKNTIVCSSMKKNFITHFVTFIISIILIGVANAKLPPNTKQLIIGIAPNANSSHVTLSIFEKNANQWQQQGKAWKGRLGKNGLAWGLGLHPTGLSGLHKKEGDGRSPAGLFKIGSGSSYAFGYAPTITKQPSLPYKQITTKDLWVEDSNSAHYNRHILINHTPKTKWEKSAQMRQGDYAHSLKLFIAHNEGTTEKRAKANAGSAIFFHIWRSNGAKATAGCTTMNADKLKQLIARINPSKEPVYLLLTNEDYKKYRGAWLLP